MKFRILTLLILAVVCMHALTAEGSEPWAPSRHSYVPPKGYVPDSKTAILIAVAVWTPIYGEDQIKKKKPYQAELKDGIWHVRGSLPKGYVGGVPEAEIDQKTAKILRIQHQTFVVISHGIVPAELTRPMLILTSYRGSLNADVR